MTPKMIVGAFRAMDELACVSFPFKVARQVAALQRRLKEEVDVICTTEENLIEKYGGTMDRKKQITFKEPDALVKYCAERDELFAEEVEIDLPVVDLSQYSEQINITPSALSALDGLVTFDKEDNADG